MKLANYLFAVDVKFNDPIAAFKSKTTFELLRGYVVYVLCSSSFLVDNNMKVRISIIQVELVNPAEESRANNQRKSL